MTTRAHLVEAGQVGNDSQMRDASCMRDGGPDVIDQLLLNQIFTVPHRVKNLANCQWRGGVVTDEFEGLLIFCWCRIFQPEQVKGLEFFAKATGFNRCQAMVCIVQLMRIWTDRFTHSLKQAWRVTQILFGAPIVLAW